MSPVYFVKDVAGWTKAEGRRQKAEARRQEAGGRRQEAERGNPE
jgi:hypothetical protein